MSLSVCTMRLSASMEMWSFPRLLKRHSSSEKHLDRYAHEFAGRNNLRPLGTPEQMEKVARGLVGKRLRYSDLVAWYDPSCPERPPSARVRRWPRGCGRSCEASVARTRSRASPLT